MFKSEICISYLMKTAEKRTEATLTLETLTDDEFYQWCAQEARNDPSEWSRLISVEGGHESNTVPAIVPWEAYLGDCKRVVALAQSNVPLREALDIIGNQEQSHLVRYFRSLSSTDHTGVMDNDSMKPRARVRYERRLEDLYCAHRPEQALRPHHRWHHQLVAPIATALFVVGGFAGLHYGVIKPDIEQTIDDKTHAAEERFSPERMIPRTVNYIKTHPELFDDPELSALASQYLDEYAIPRIRSEVRAELDASNQHLPEQVVEGVIAYIKENPDRLNDPELSQYLSNYLVDAMANADQEKIDELGSRLGGAIRRGMFGYD